LKRSDSAGQIDVPDRNSFFGIMTPTTLNIISSRRNVITKTIDVIDLNLMNKIKIDNDPQGNMVYNGGLKSMGT